MEEVGMNIGLILVATTKTGDIAALAERVDAPQVELAVEER
jgi:hypothetical protein